MGIASSGQALVLTLTSKSLLVKPGTGQAHVCSTASCSHVGTVLLKQAQAFITTCMSVKAASFPGGQQDQRDSFVVPTTQPPQCFTLVQQCFACRVVQPCAGVPCFPGDTCGGASHAKWGLQDPIS